MTDGPPWYPRPTPASPVATLPEQAGLADVVASGRVGFSSACPAPVPAMPASSKPPPWSQLRIDRVMALARAYNWASVCEAIEEGFPLEEQDGLEHGDTLLHLAARAGQVPTIASALARGADPNVVNNWGLTPTCVAAAWGTPEALAALVAGGGDAGAGSPPALLHLLAAYVPEWDPWSVCLDPGVRDKMTLLLRQPCTDLQATWMGDTAVALVQRWRGVVGAEAAAEEALDLIHAEVCVVYGRYTVRPLQLGRGWGGGGDMLLAVARATASVAVGCAVCPHCPPRLQCLSTWVLLRKCSPHPHPNGISLPCFLDCISGTCSSAVVCTAGCMGDIGRQTRHPQEHQARERVVTLQVVLCWASPAYTYVCV